MRILLVAGHGGNPYDSGAVGNGYKEAELTREFVAELREQLYTDVDIFDMSKDLYKYLKSHTFNFQKYDYVFEVHFNSASTPYDGKTTGTEILVHTNRQDDKSFEQLLCKEISKLGFTNRGVRARNNLQNMNVCTKQGVMYSLLEVCFISDKDDMNLYQGVKADYIKTVANCFTKYFNLVILGTNDIVDALYERNIITDKTVWKLKLSTNNNAYWLAYKGANYTANSFYQKDLTLINDIVWELHHRKIITEKDRWLKLLDEDRNLYWLAYKIANYTENKRK